MCTGLRQNASITSLNLSTDTGFKKNVLGERGAEALAAVLKERNTLRTLRMGNVGGNGLATLALHGLHSTKSVRVLDLRMNHIGDEAIYDVLAPLQDSLIEELDLSRNDLTDTSTTAILGLIETSKSLRSLDLSWNSLGKPFTSSLSKVLEASTTLESLCLDGNSQLGAQKGANPIFEGLLKNSRLRSLSLAKCNIKDCTLIGRLLKNSQSMQELNLSNNHIVDDGCVSIARALETNPALTRLDLSYNSIGDEGGLKLATCLKSNKCLQELFLKDNRITNATAEQLLELVRQKNSTLSRLSMQLNGISLKLTSAIEEALRHNKANVRAAKILSYHREVEALQNEERNIREAVQAIQKELVFQSPEMAYEEVRKATAGLEGFKANEENKVRFIDTLPRLNFTDADAFFRHWNSKERMRRFQLDLEQKSKKGQQCVRSWSQNIAESIACRLTPHISLT